MGKRFRCREAPCARLIQTLNTALVCGKVGGMTTPQPGKQDFLLSGETLRVPEGTLIHLSHALMLRGWVCHPPLNREPGSLEGNWRSLRAPIPPPSEGSLACHLVSLLVAGKTTMTRDPLKQHLAWDGFQDAHNLRQSRVVFQLTLPQG